MATLKAICGVYLLFDKVYLIYISAEMILQK